MAKKALIAEPDVDEARKQAAILADDGYEVGLLTAGDVIQEIAEAVPDVVVLRHERPGQNGLALVQRIKRMPKLAGSALVLTTSDLPPETIERHKAQRYRADAYVRLPVRRQDLVEAARSLPEVLEADDVAAEAEPEPPVGAGGRRPPLPPARRGDRLPVSRQGEGLILTPEDLAFVEDVFSTITLSAVTDAAAEDPSVGPRDQDLPEGPDRKLALLRQKVREHEQQIARLKVLWTQRQEELKVAEARIETKAIEVEGLHLRIRELEEEVAAGHRTLDEKVAEFGRSLGEHFDARSLGEAELIQEVAGKEHELNNLHRALMRTEEERDRIQRELTERVFEWERAYRDLEGHHWKVVDASAAEVLRLEQQIAGREARAAALKASLKDREISLAYERARHEATLRALRAEQRARAHEREDLCRLADIIHRFERRERLALEEKTKSLVGRVLELEESLFRHARLLPWLDASRRRQLAALAANERDRAQDVARANAELEVLRAASARLETTLSSERALGEAAIQDLFDQSDKERLIARAQGAHLGARIDALLLERAALSEELSGTRAQLAGEEREHAQERERAQALEREFALERARAASLEEQLRARVVALEQEGAARARDLEETVDKLTRKQEDLAEERRLRAHDQGEARLALERRDSELREQRATVVELERDLNGAREDVSALKATLGSREERVAELSSQMRAADEQIVRLEGHVGRLETTVAERRADLEALSEREATLHKKLSEREAWGEALSSEVEAARRALTGAEARIEQAEERGGALEAFLDEERRAHEETRAALSASQAAGGAAVERGNALEQELARARVEIEAGGAMLEDFQGQLHSAERHTEALRDALVEREALVAELREEVSAQAGALDDAAAVKERAELELARLHQELAGRTEALSRHESALAELCDERDRLADALKVAADERPRGDAGRVQALNHELAGLKAALAERDRLLGELRQELVETGERAEGAQRTLARVTTAHESSRSQAAGFEAQLTAQAHRHALEVQRVKQAYEAERQRLWREVLAARRAAAQASGTSAGGQRPTAPATEAAGPSQAAVHRAPLEAAPSSASAARVAPAMAPAGPAKPDA